MNLLQKIEQEEIKKLTEAHAVPDFRAGDTVKVTIPRWIVPKSDKKTKKVDPILKEEIVEGICLGRTSRGMGSNFTIRKMMKNNGVEITFPLYSYKIELIRRGRVRRAKIYYLSKLSGKKAKIQEKRVGLKPTA